MEEKEEFDQVCDRCKKKPAKPYLFEHYFTRDGDGPKLYFCSDCYRQKKFEVR